MNVLHAVKPGHLILALALVTANGVKAQDLSDDPTRGRFFGNLKLGFITSEDDAGENSDGSAIGGKLGYIGPRLKGLSAGATVYTTQKLFDDENGDFFASDGSGYSIIGEAYVQANFGNSEVKAGRFEFDSPHADTDDIRMIPNTFQGALITNRSIPATTLYLGHLDQWAGVDTEEPENFNDTNDGHGVTMLGTGYEGFENLGLQAWYYLGNNLSRLAYLEATYETDNFSIGAQYGSQSDDTTDGTGPDGDIFGLIGSYSMADLTFTAAYNDVSGIIVNGYGGGPYFTSADDHTVEGVEDQKAVAMGVEYGGIGGSTFGIQHADFDKGEDETNLYAIFEFNDQLSFELIYSDMKGDGDSVRLMGNLRF